MRKAIKIITVIILGLVTIAAALFATYAIITKDAVLDAGKLVGAGQNVSILDEDGNEIASTGLGAQKKSVAVRNLNKDTVNAFIASEDRDFYKHNGLNYKRMLKALYKNLTSRSFKEGASTISQQLIKNTHLSNDKTIKRKLNEIKLTRRLEKKYEKDEILEMYLNTIYFGHNCYGLQSAAEFYFGKKAENLNLTESATIVGLLISPNNFSPFKNPEKSLKRRNIVLRNMRDCGYINHSRYETAINTPLEAVKQDTENKYGGYINAVFDELEDINFDYYALTDGCAIVTYMDSALQDETERAEYPCDNAVIVTDNNSGGIKVYKSTIGEVRRQPGSTVKPIFVYAPAIEEKLLSPFTRILDEKIDFNGYSPENFDKNYHGYVSVSESVKKSYNVPAVKTLNSLTVKKCEKYLTAMNVKLEDDEKNLSLALGGMKYGLTIKDIADKYSIFPEGGNYRPSRFIKKIISKDGKTLYENRTVKNNVFSAGTCSLINDMLIETTKSGTARKLKNFDFDLASKTGTCGNQEGNTDAYAVSYTSEHCVAVWLGDKDNKRTAITGGNDCCAVMERLIGEMYSDRRPLPLDTQSGTEQVNIDLDEYTDNNKVVLADPASPKFNVMTVKVLKGNAPLQQTDRFSKPTVNTPTISVSENKVNIELCQTKYYSYIIKRAKNGKIDVIYDGKWKKVIEDTPTEGCYTYTVIPYYDNGKERFYGNEMVLPSVNLSKNGKDVQTEIPDIVNKDWFNQ